MGILMKKRPVLTRSLARAHVLYRMIMSVSLQRSLESPQTDLRIPLSCMSRDFTRCIDQS